MTKINYKDMHFLKKIFLIVKNFQYKNAKYKLLYDNIGGML